MLGCQSAPTVSQNQFTPFELRKIIERGIQTVDLSPSKSDWPNLKYKDLKPFSFKSDNLKIAILGDTGCRLIENQFGAKYQDCPNPKEWPYAKAVATITKETYDFAIHTGDYHYREKCTDAVLCPQLTKSLGYGWPAWWDDFYGPSQALFEKSPLLFVRGNHEDCNRAYSGWGPLSSSNKKFQDRCHEIEPYQWIEMGDLVLINFDDSAFIDREELKTGDREKWVQQLKQLEMRLAELKNKKEIWFIAHKPVVGFMPDKSTAEPIEIKKNLYSVMKEVGLLSRIDFLLAGHLHSQQLMNSADLPLQIVVGATGTALEPFGRKIMNEKLTTTTENKYSFSYAVFERTGFKRWHWQFKDLDGVTQLDCKVNEGKANCELLN